MFYKVTAVTALPNYFLSVEFDTGEQKQYDVQVLFDKWEIFKDLKKHSLFEKVQVDMGGYGVSWNDEIDLSSNELYENGWIV